MKGRPWTCELSLDRGPRETRCGLGGDDLTPSCGCLVSSPLSGPRGGKEREVPRPPRCRQGRRRPDRCELGWSPGRYHSGRGVEEACDYFGKAVARSSEAALSDSYADLARWLTFDDRQEPRSRVPRSRRKEKPALAPQWLRFSGERDDGVQRPQARGRSALRTANEPRSGITRDRSPTLPHRRRGRATRARSRALRGG